LAVKSTNISEDDLLLIARINQGDEEAFSTLYYRHREWVLRTACRICGCEHQAQDVMQEVFRYFLGKFPGFQLRCQLRTFLYPAVRNLSLTALRGSRRFVSGESADALLEQLAAPDQASSAQDDLLHLISSLSEDHREILLLRFVDGMTLPEISEMISVPLGTVKSRLHHALGALRGKPHLRNPSTRLNEVPAPCAQPTGGP
jgi:RNA polymerase sigma-70 factor, ECF subfamily